MKIDPRCVLITWIFSYMIEYNILNNKINISKLFQVYKKWKRKSRTAVALVKFSKRNKNDGFSKTGKFEQTYQMSDLDNSELLIVDSLPRHNKDVWNEWWRLDGLGKGNDVEMAFLKLWLFGNMQWIAASDVDVQSIHFQRELYWNCEIALLKLCRWHWQSRKYPFPMIEFWTILASRLASRWKNEQ